MRITCTATRRGNIYQLYRTDGEFFAKLRPLLPALLKAKGELVVGEDETTVTPLLVTAGPLPWDAEKEFLELAASYFDLDPDPTIVAIDAFAESVLPEPASPEELSGDDSSSMAPCAAGCCC